MFQNNFTLAELNSIAGRFNLELVEATGYYYWRSSSHEINIIIANIHHHTIHTRSFTNVPKQVWMGYLQKVLVELAAGLFR